MTLYIPSPFSRMMRRMASNQWMDPLSDEGSMLTFPIDIREDDDAYTLSAVLPGLKAEDLNIQIHDNVITISGEVKYERKEQDRYLLIERASGKFSRSFTLPDDVDADKAEARLEDGILNLRLPRAEHAKPKTIKIVTK